LGFIAGALFTVPAYFVLAIHDGIIKVRALIVLMIFTGLFPGSYVGAQYWRPRARSTDKGSSPAGTGSEQG
jgi:hypothetical protein